MTWRKAAAIVICVGLWLASTYGQEPVPAAKYAAGELLIRFRDSASPTRRASFMAAQAARRIRRFEVLGVEHVRLRAGQTVESALAAFQQDPDVQFAQPNYERRPVEVGPPNDPLWLNDTLWGMRKIGAQAAWSDYTTGTDTVVASIDTGVNYGHPDLIANMWHNPGEVAGNGLDDDANGYIDDVYGIDTANNDSDPMDDFGHGTHTAGTMAASGNNGIGVVGVSWHSKILACKFIAASGSGFDSDAIECFNYVVGMKNRGVNIRVTNNSWGSARQPFGIPTAMQNAIQALGTAGILNVFAAGNSSANSDVTPFDPAAIPLASIVSVASSDSNDGRSGTTNYGATSVDLAAPGVGIASTYGNDYGGLSGTSMAAPHVAGAIALIASARPSVTPAEIKGYLIANVDLLPQWTGFVASGGRLNVWRALVAAGANAKPSVSLTNPADGATYPAPGAMTIMASASDTDGTIASVAFFVNGAPLGQDATYPYAFPWPGGAPGTYVIKAVATDNGGAIRESANATITVSAPTGGQAPIYGYQIVKSYPHDSGAFTQGLILLNGKLYESTGLYGGSSLREVNLLTGAVLRRVEVPPQYFAEGMTIFQGKIFQLTWQGQVGFIYDPSTFSLLGQFSYTGEGWGLTHDNQHLIMSDGTNQIRFIDPVTFQTVRSIGVYDHQGQPLGNINELEYINGEIYANIWQTNWIVRIDPITGRIVAWIDMTGLLPAGTPADVLNGIAYDAASGHLLVTGKFWPSLFEIAVVGSVPSGATATFVRVDVTTQGNWIGTYGADGHSLVGDTTSYPAYAQVTVAGAATHVWAGSTADLRGLKRSSGNGRLAATWYGGTISFDVTLTDGQPHQVALYGLDWDLAGRVEQVDVLDAATGAVLDSRTLTGFGGGQYAVWTLTRHVVLRITRTAGTNAVVSGLFFGGTSTPGGDPPTATATFAGTDVTTQGNWIGTYGADGHSLVGDTTSYPAYAQVTVTGAAAHVWAGSTADLRGLRRSSGSGRLAATWYGDTFSVDVALTDGQPHQVAVYGLDWDLAGRVEQVDVLDAGTGAVLDSRTLTGFGGGQYAVWTLTGHVVLRITRTAGTNAIVSGLFFGGTSASGGEPPTATAAFAGTAVTTKGVSRQSLWALRQQPNTRLPGVHLPSASRGRRDLLSRLQPGPFARQSPLGRGASAEAQNLESAGTPSTAETREASGSPKPPTMGSFPS